MQDLTEDTPELDLDAALTRTRARHDELVRARNVRRRWVTGGALAVLLVAAAVIVPQLGSGNGQRVNVAARRRCRGNDVDHRHARVPDDDGR